MSTHPDIETRVAQIVRERDIQVDFEPVVDMVLGETVAVEAIVRGPDDVHDVYREARAQGIAGELDWVYRAAAMKALLDAKCPPTLTLLVSIDPMSLGVPCPNDLLTVVSRAESTLRVIVEVSDRALAEDPAALLAVEHRARDKGWGLALSDVGTGPGAVAMIPVVRPDMVKIDLDLLRDVIEVDASAVILAAMRHAEVTGASLCVTGIATEDDARWAHAMGAQYGQGPWVARQGPLPASLPQPRRPIPLVTPAVGEGASATPWGVMADVEPRRMPREQFLHLMRVMAGGSVSRGAAPLFLAGAGHQAFDPSVSERFPEQQRGPILAALFGVGMERLQAEGLRGVGLDPSDPLAQSEFFVLVGARGSYALVGAPEDGDRILAYLTQQPEVVHFIARYLLRRIPPPGGDGRALPPPIAGVESGESNGRAWAGNRPFAGT